MTRDEVENCIQELGRATEKTVSSFRELFDRKLEIDQLFQKATLLQAAVTLNEGYAEISKFARSLFPADAGALYFRSLSSPEDRFEAVRPDSTGMHVGFERDDCRALRTGKVHTVDADSTPIRCKHVARSCSSYMCVPMMAHGEVLGVFHLATKSLGRNEPKGKRIRLPEAKRGLAIAFANHVALAVANLRQREILTQHATRDPLTGLLNRRTLDETLTREIRRASPGKKRRSAERGTKAKSIGVIMIDLDHFKQFNDKSQSAGDDVLRALGKILRDFCRRVGDVAFRRGGDEFYVILPGASRKNSRRRAEELREQIESLEMHYEGKPMDQVTASIGVAAYPDDGDTPRDLFRAANDALIQAKKMRNRVEVARRRE
jgi:diguanylate cyclase (GGDEF)-like protein